MVVMVIDQMVIDQMVIDQMVIDHGLVLIKVLIVTSGASDCGGGRLPPDNSADAFTSVGRPLIREWFSFLIWMHTKFRLNKHFESNFHIFDNKSVLFIDVHWNRDGLELRQTLQQMIIGLTFQMF